MMNSFRSFLCTLAKLLVLPWRLASHQPSPPAAPSWRQQGSPGPAEEDVELGLYLLR